jgi:ssDNA-binding replication factor A large subunit
MDLTLWNDEVGTVDAGDKVKLTDGWCKEWNGRKQASTGKNGKLEKL